MTKLLAKDLSQYTDQELRDLISERRSKRMAPIPKKEKKKSESVTKSSISAKKVEKEVSNLMKSLKISPEAIKNLQAQLEKLK